MEILSITGPVGALLGATHLDSQVGISLSITRKKSKKPVLFDASSSSSSFSVYYTSSRTASVGKMREFYCNCSKLGFFNSSQSKTRSFALKMALDEETPRPVSMDEEEKNIETEMESEAANLGDFAEEQIERVKESPTSLKIDVRALAHSMRECKTADDVEEVLDKIEELPPLPVYSSLIKGFGMNKKLDAAFAILEWLKMKKNCGHESMAPNLFIYHNLLGAVKNAERFEEVDRVLADMTDQGILPSIVTYNLLMSVYIDQGKPSKVFKVLDTIKVQGLQPSFVTYSTALVAYWRLEDASGALQLYVDLRERYTKARIGCNSDENWEEGFAKIKDFTARICYQLMRQWLVKEEDPSIRIMQVLYDMDKSQLPPGRRQCEKLIWACTIEGHYNIAKELYRRLRDMNDGISLSACNHVIWLMGKAKKWWAALEVYEDLLDKGPKPNNLSYELIMSHFSLLLTSARKKANWRWGIRLINKMEEKGLRPSHRQWNAVLIACSKASEASAAIQIFNRMIDQGHRPTVISYGALLSALEKGKLYDDAIRVWQHMLKIGVQPNLYAYTVLVSIYIGKGELEWVNAVIQEMVSSGIEPTVVTYNAIISACARQKLGSAAFEWFHRMRVKNLCPDEITYEMLVEALAGDGKPKLAYDMYMRASNEGLHLSSKAYDALVDSCLIHGATVDLDAVGLWTPAKRKATQTSKFNENL